MAVHVRVGVAEPVIESRARARERYRGRVTDQVHGGVPVHVHANDQGFGHAHVHGHVHGHVTGPFGSFGLDGPPLTGSPRGPRPVMQTLHDTLVCMSSGKVAPSRVTCNSLALRHLSSSTSDQQGGVASTAQAGSAVSCVCFCASV